MRILHINSYYLKGRFYTYLYNKQVENNLDITVYTPVPKSTNANLKVFPLYTDLSLNHGKYDRYIFHLKHKKILKDALSRYSKEKFDIIHAHSLFSNGYIAYHLSKSFGIPYIVALRNSDVNFFFKKIFYLRRVGIKILVNASNVVFISQPYMMETINKYIPKKYQQKILKKSIVVPNGISDFWLNNIHKNKLNTDILRIITPGQICKNKNQLMVCKSLSYLVKKGIRLEFLVVGEIVNTSYLRKILDYTFVRHINHVNKNELKEIFRRSDIMVLPSITETFGLVYPEAMSQGVPVIYSKGQGFDRQFQEGTVGYHVDPKNPTEIANKIIKITNNYDVISRNCSAMVVRFDWRKIEYSYLKIYKEIVFPPTMNDSKLILK